MTLFEAEIYVNTIPSLHRIVQISNEINEWVVSDFAVSKALGECALATQDKKESLEFHNLAASRGNVKSIMSLIKHQELLQRQKDCATIQTMISAGKNGDAKITEQLIQQAKVADMNTLIALFEQARDAKEIYHAQDDYSFKIVEAASSSNHPITLSVLDMICYHTIGMFQDIKMKLQQAEPDLAKLAEGGNIMAQWALGVIIKDRWDYYRSVKWLSKSAPHMLLALQGELYNRGYRDAVRSRSYPAEAKLCYKQCAEFGYAPSKMRLEALGLADNNNSTAEKPKADVQQQQQPNIKACYGVMYDNPMLNVENFAKLAKIAHREQLFMPHHDEIYRTGAYAVNKLLDVGQDPQKWSTFKLLQDVVGDVGAVRWALKHEQNENNVQLNAPSVPIMPEDSVMSEKLHAQAEWFMQTGQMLRTLSDTMGHGVATVVKLPHALRAVALHETQDDTDHTYTNAHIDTVVMHGRPINPLIQRSSLSGGGASRRGKYYQLYRKQ